MNKSYRTVWNASTGTWTAAAETARASKKSKSNSTMRSSVTAAVAVMAGVGGVAMSADVSAQTLPTGNGGLALCGPSSGLAYGPGGSVGVGSCNLTTSPYAPGHEMAFQLTNNAAANGGTTGSASDKQYWANIVGTKDGNIFVNGGSGIHFSGAADFDSNVSMTNNRITNLAAGTAGTDAVNVSQLNAAIANVSTTNPYFKVDTASGADAAQAGVGAFAAGANAQGVGQNAAAIGNNASASGMNATAIGISTSATGAASTALGMSAKATQSHATALGVGASAVGVNSIALGVNGTASGMGSVAIGEVARASADGAVALGTGSVADRANSVSVGAANAQRQIVNVAAGTQDSDAVNLGQLNAAVANVSTSGNRFINIATGSYAADAPAVAAGSATAIGANASATGISGVALGGNSVASGSSTVALGTLANATATDATAVGVSARATGNAATAMGRSAQATGNNSTALGNATSAVGAGSIALGNGSVANRGNALSIGNVGAERQIINVAAGTAATDAVNVSQLTGVTAALGGGAAIGTNGSVTQPTYSVDGKDYHNVGDALDALASSGIGNPNAVIYDDATKGSVTLGGTGATTPVALSNVKAGTADTDAVNVSQLKDSGLIGDDGKAIAAVTYDRNADGTPNLGSVTLGGEGSTTPVALKNVADAKDDHDALNLGQLKNAGLVGEDANGDLTSAAVTYDTNADGTINHDKATLAGTDGTTL
ncbi:adhesin, partial [Burkholderia sp. AU31624]|uniref:ESPR-type extended signal peptide-containing protein n=1 Tax=Burkholderia sp. AU31624 TaxID=2879629 RepID=UPI0021F4B952